MPISPRSPRLALVAGIALYAPGSVDAAPKQQADPQDSAAESDATPTKAAKKKAKKAAKKKAKGSTADDGTSPAQDAPSVADVMKKSLHGGQEYRSIATRQTGVGLDPLTLPPLFAMQAFSLKFTSPEQGRPRGIGIEPVSPGIRYDFSNADSKFKYSMSATWRELTGFAEMKHVTAVCGMHSACTIDVNYQLDTEVPVLAGFALRFTEHHDMSSISIMPNGERDYAVQVKGTGKGTGTYVIDLYLAVLDRGVVLETAMISGERQGESRAANVEKIDMYNPTPKTHRLLQGFSVTMTDGAHPVAELSISDVSISGPAEVVFQDVTGKRPMKARLYWVLAR